MHMQQSIHAINTLKDRKKNENYGYMYYMYLQSSKYILYTNYIRAHICPTHVIAKFWQFPQLTLHNSSLQS